MEAPLRTLDYFLNTVGASPGFEVLVIDVEGLEWEVLLGFSALRWRPRVVIVESEDTHESFRSIDFLQARVPHPVAGHTAGSPCRICLIAEPQL